LGDLDLPARSSPTPLRPRAGPGITVVGGDRGQGAGETTRNLSQTSRAGKPDGNVPLGDMARQAETYQKPSKVPVRGLRSARRAKQALDLREAGYLFRRIAAEMQTSTTQAHRLVTTQYKQFRAG
jgi:hypothetical protein